MNAGQSSLDETDSERLDRLYADDHLDQYRLPESPTHTKKHASRLTTPDLGKSSKGNNVEQLSIDFVNTGYHPRTRGEMTRTIHLARRTAGLPRTTFPKNKYRDTWLAQLMDNRRMSEYITDEKAKQAAA